VPQQAVFEVDPSRRTLDICGLKLGLGLAEVQAALNAGILGHLDLISSVVRLTAMESFFSPYRGSSTSKYPQVCADDNGDSASVLRQAIRVLNVPTGKHCAKVQDSSTGEGITEEEDAEPFWSVILQRHKAEGIVGLGKVYPYFPLKPLFFFGSLC
jgi:hypothetical protein